MAEGARQIAQVEKAGLAWSCLVLLRPFTSPYLVLLGHSLPECLAGGRVTDHDQRPHHDLRGAGPLVGWSSMARTGGTGGAAGELQMCRRATGLHLVRKPHGGLTLASPSARSRREVICYTVMPR